MRIHTKEVSPYIVLMCSQCGVQIAHWKKPEEGRKSYEQLWYQHHYVFGKVPELSWALRHELR